MKNVLMKIVPNSILRKASRQILVAKKNSPTIFFVAGVAGVITSTVLACRATMKLSDTLDEVKKDIDNQKAIMPSRPEKTEHHLDEYYDYHRTNLEIYAGASFKIAKLYAPPVILGTASIALLASSHVTLVRRNSALMAAYTAMHEAMERYRARVREAVGAEKEQEIYTGGEVLRDPIGDVAAIRVTDPSEFSPYAKFFDEYSPYWVKNAEYNRIFLTVQQNFANHKLRAYGHVFLNEVYDSLGIPRTTQGAVVGWIKDGDGDDYIDFGLYAPYSSRFLNGEERSVLLDFNVDGVIYDKI